MRKKKPQNECWRREEPNTGKEIAQRTLKEFPSLQSSSWIVLLFWLQLFISFQTISPSCFENTPLIYLSPPPPSLTLSLSVLISGLDLSQKAREGLRLASALRSHRLVNCSWTFDTWAKVIQLYKVKSILGQIGCRVFAVWWLYKWTSGWRIASSIPQAKK